ncbi:hypothetical protein [Nostoc sp. 'Lobaria pulmonaria (5183) cyanobiont']|uniref:hypothetical protein n=1 Tax=Nostoc sp. 'Lobaria pulmonaria (5183) cyanobiont' TaxID=1618022 RepID=UPI001F22C522|nr:hypothetical protein [Nostoc sp. 'Lobaria pulmonaria (5183) cyanobiont']
MTNTILNFQTAIGHKVLAATDKKYLRSGGRIATDKLFQWANISAWRIISLSLRFLIPKYYNLVFFS